MSDPRLLSAEKLAEYRKLSKRFPYIPRFRVALGLEKPLRQRMESLRALLDHIAALTEQLSTLRTESVKLGHESGCASLSRKCVHCGSPRTLEATSMCWAAPTLRYHQAPDCNCAQSRIQEGKDA